MTRAEIERIVTEQVQFVARSDEMTASVTLDSNLKDIDLDDIDIMEIHLQLEDKFNIFIHDDATEKWQTVRDIVDYVEKTIQEPQEE